MTMRTPLLACALAGLSLVLLPTPIHAAPPAQSAAADTPAVAVVRQFLADRTAGHYDAAYALLSSASKQGITAAQFAQGDPPTVQDESMPPVLFAVTTLFFDVRGLSGDTFSIIGPDPADPHVVRVRAVRPSQPAALLHVLTVRDPQTHALRLDILGSMQRTVPAVTATLRQSTARLLSLSNLNDLAASIQQYAQDHNLLLPDAANWADEILPYVKSKGAFHDPSAPAGQVWSYAYNRALSHRSLALLENPAATVLVFESSLGVKNASDTGQSVPHPGRHFGGTDYAFADGHVKWMPGGTKLSYRLDGK